MNPKIQKIGNEIEKTRQKIADLQGRLRDMEQQKTELENAEIVAAVRTMKTLPEDFGALLAALQNGKLPGAAPAPAAPATAPASAFSAASHTSKEDVDDED